MLAKKRANRIFGISSKVGTGTSRSNRLLVPAAMLLRDEAAIVRDDAVRMAPVAIATVVVNDRAAAMKSDRGHHAKLQLPLPIKLRANVHLAAKRLRGGKTDRVAVSRAMRHRAAISVPRDNLNRQSNVLLVQLHLDQ